MLEIIEFARSCSLTEIKAELTQLTAHISAAERRWLWLVAEFDDREGWHDDSCFSCAHWLNVYCGMSLRAAYDRIRVAHALETLPKISAAMGRGEIGYSKVRALVRVATAATEDYLLNIALHGTAHHVERVVRDFRRALEAEELSREARQYAGRRVSYFYDDDGSFVLKARLPAETGMLLQKALDAALEEIAIPGEQTSRAARRADALGSLAETFVKSGPQALTGGERHGIIVHIDAETLRHSVAGRCELETGPSVFAETARRLACDSSVVLLVEDERGEPLDVGRRTRSIPAALRRTLNARDKTCRFPGCTHARYVDFHHVTHWVHGGETKASNLVKLCRWHHRELHEGHIAIQVLDDGAFRFVWSDGRSLEGSVRTDVRGDWTQLPLQHREQGIHIDPKTGVSRWSGERLEYNMAVDQLLRLRKRAVCDSDR